MPRFFCSNELSVLWPRKVRELSTKKTAYGGGSDTTQTQISDEQIHHDAIITNRAPTHNLCEDTSRTESNGRGKEAGSHREHSTTQYDTRETSSHVSTHKSTVSAAESRGETSSKANYKHPPQQGSREKSETNGHEREVFWN